MTGYRALWPGQRVSFAWTGSHADYGRHVADEIYVVDTPGSVDAAINELLDRVCDWAKQRTDVLALGLTGSFRRAEPKTSLARA